MSYRLDFVTHISLGDDDDVEVIVQADMTPGSPARGPSWGSGGEPADPGDCNITSVKRTSGTDELLPAIRAADDAAHTVWMLSPAPRPMPPMTIEERLIAKAYEEARDGDEY